jgi:glycogen debranching enzyme
LETGQTAFANRFWNESKGYLCDVVDVAYQRGVDDVSLRPNQIFAVGGLPLSLVDPIKARQVVDVVERRLLTPVGIRSLDPEHSDYKPAYRGGVWERDGAYHQGTVWPWLLGPFFEAWLRVHKPTAANRRQASQRFLRPWLDQLESNGLGHVSEVADGDPPHRAGGCPFQAWSLAELLRAQSLVQSQAQSSVAPVSPISRKIGRR